MILAYERALWQAQSVTKRTEIVTKRTEFYCVGRNLSLVTSAISRYDSRVFIKYKGSIMETKYNGWANYATFRVNLEIFDGQTARDCGWCRGTSAYDFAQSLKDYAEQIIEDTSSEGLARGSAPKPGTCRVQSTIGEIRMNSAYRKLVARQQRRAAIRETIAAIPEFILIVVALSWLLLAVLG